MLLMEFKMFFDKTGNVKVGMIVSFSSSEVHLDLVILHFNQVLR